MLRLFQPWLSIIVIVSPLVYADGATFTFGPATNYAVPAAGAPSPTVGGLRISPTIQAGIPEQGIDIVFGPAVQSSIKAALDGPCASGWSQDCATALAQAIDNQHAFKLAARDAGIEALPLYGGAIAVAGFGALVQHEVDRPKTITGVHLPSTDLAQLQTQTTVPLLIIAPSSTSSIGLSAIATPTISSGAPSIVTLTVDKDAHHKGDVILSIPGDSAQAIMQMISNEGGHEQCKNVTTTSRKRQLRQRGTGTADYKQIDNYVSLILNRSPKVLFDALMVGVPAVLPAFRDYRDRASVAAAQAAAARLARFQGVDSSWVKALASYLWAAVYEVCANDALSVENIVLEEWFVEDRAHEECPLQERDWPACGDCNGSREEKCTTGEQTGCFCLPMGSYTHHPGDRANWDQAQAVLVSMVGEIGSPDVPSGPQQIAWASYVNPKADPGAWGRFVAYPGNKFTLLVANALNGPDAVVDPAWKDAIDRVAASGKKIIAYVRTGYLGVSQQQFRTRLNSLELSDWVAQIEQDVDAWYLLYGSNIGGIFFDEGWPECGPDNLYANTYKHINAYTKRKYGNVLTVLNPGSPMAACFEATMDTLMTFESSLKAYTTAYVPNNWTPKDNRKIWHIIYDVPKSEIQNVVKLAKERGAGLLHITQDGMPNPYDNLDDDDYIQTLLGAVEGNTLSMSPAPPFPKAEDFPSVTSLVQGRLDYTSVQLLWTGTAAGFRVYVNDHAVLDIPGWMTSTTIGSLPPGSRDLKFVVAPIGRNGLQGPPSDELTASTLEITGGNPVTELVYHQETADAVTYKATLVKPYGFVRLFFCCHSKDCDLDSRPGPVQRNAWLIQYGIQYDERARCRFLIERETLMSYSSPDEVSATVATWSWTALSQVKHEVNGYTHTWTIPKNAAASSAIDYMKEYGGSFVVQGQGYNTLLNILGPCRAIQSPIFQPNMFCMG